jgi:PAS domain S-box-containing protein
MQVNLNTLTTKFIVFLIPITILVLGAGSYFHYQSTSRMLDRAMDDKVEFYLNGLTIMASDYLQNFEDDLLTDMITVIQNEEEVVYAVIRDSSGKVEYGAVAEGDQLYIYSKQIPPGDSELHADLGRMEVGMDRSRHQAVLRGMLSNQLMLLLLMVVILALTTILFFRRMISQPLQQLTDATERIAEGKSATIPDIHSGVELMLLAKSFRVMMTHLNTSQHSLQQLADSLEEQVDDRTQALEQAMLESTEQKNQMDLILQSMDEGLVVVDPQGNITKFNQKLEQMVGRSKQDLLGISFQSLFVEQEMDALLENLFSFEGMLIGEGEGIPVQVSGALLEHEQNREKMVDGTVLVIHDLSERLQAERREGYAAFQAGIAEMSAMILHNIGNSLTGIEGGVMRIEKGVGALRRIDLLFSRVLEILDAHKTVCIDAEVDTAELDKVRMVVDRSIGSLLSSQLDQIEGQSLLRMKQSLQHISEIIRVQQNSVKRGLHVSVFYFKEVIHDVLLMQQDTLEKLNIEVEQQFDSVSDKVRLPKNQMVQAINNLVKNGYESIIERMQKEPSLQGRIALSVKRQGDELVVRLSDNGVGIEPEQLEQLFVFGYSNKERGSGFGLHATANFIHNLKGTIQFESEGLDRGATVVLCFPVEASEA